MNGAYCLHSLSGRYLSRSCPCPLYPTWRESFIYPHTATCTAFILLSWRNWIDYEVCSALSLKASLLVLLSFIDFDESFWPSFKQPMYISFPLCIRLFSMNVVFSVHGALYLSQMTNEKLFISLDRLHFALYLVKAGTRYSQPFRSQHLVSTCNIRWRNRSHVIFIVIILSLIPFTSAFFHIIQEIPFVELPLINKLPITRNECYFCPLDSSCLSHWLLLTFLF